MIIECSFLSSMSLAPLYNHLYHFQSDLPETSFTRNATTQNHFRRFQKKGATKSTIAGTHTEALSCISHTSVQPSASRADNIKLPKFEISVVCVQDYSVYYSKIAYLYLHFVLFESRKPCHWTKIRLFEDALSQSHFKDQGHQTARFGKYLSG